MGGAKLDHDGEPVMQRTNFTANLGGISESLTQNDRRILGLLFRRKAMTQMSLAEETGVTQQSVSRIMADLLQSGIVQTGEKVSSGKRGYPSTAIALSPGFAYSIGLSIMADAVSLALLDLSGAILEERRQAMASLPIAALLEWTEASIREVSQARQINRDRIVGIGVAITGSFIDTGGFNTPYSLKEWAGIDIAAIFQEKFALPAFADNDGNTAAVAENILGVGRRAKNFAYLYIATGVGGGLILNGALWRGRFGNAGEYAGGLPPNIYPFPSLEFLRQLAVRHGASYESVSEMLAEFDPAWPVVDEWIARVHDSLSIIASNATSILDLDAIVLGGRIPKELAQRLIPHIELYDQKRRSIVRPKAEILPAEAVGEVTAIGAAILPLQELFFG